MNGGPRFYDLRDYDRAVAADDDELLLEDGAEDQLRRASEGPGEPRTATSRDWLIRAGIALIVIAWLGFGLWAARPLLAGGNPLDLVELVSALSVPPALIGVLWLVARRSSRAEARRFGDTAASMRAEAAALERSVATLSARIRAEQATLADQAREFIRLGEEAADRVSGVSHVMTGELANVDRGARMLNDAAAGAEERLGALLTALPRARAELEDAALLFDLTAHSAGERALALDSQMAALGERGREANAIAGDAAERLADHLERMQATSEVAGDRLERVTARMAATVDEVLEQASTAMEEARNGVAAHGDALLAMLGSSQSAMERAGRESVDALQARLEEAESATARLGQRLDAEREVSDQLVAGLDQAIDRVDHRLAQLHEGATTRNAELATSISALAGSADAMNEAMRTGDTLARTLIATAEEVLTALDADAREIDETLPAALGRLDERISTSRALVAGAKPDLLALVTAAESTHDAIEAISAVVTQQRDALNGLASMLEQALGHGRAEAEGLNRAVEATIGRSTDFAQEAAPHLAEALLRLRESANVAAERAREVLGQVIPEAAQELEKAAAGAIERAGARAVAAQVAEVGQAAEQAASLADDAAEHLQAQIKALIAATQDAQNRVDAARTRHEEAERTSMSRQVAQLIEALNSASIDIARTFSHEVTDSAWAAYLKGDRGVFTRRAVRLLDSGQAREVVQLYDSDNSFREHVHRYIHDFEGMLRHVLAEREGTPLAVTLLSSDMGKLYVALAQAIERLRP